MWRSVGLSVGPPGGSYARQPSADRASGPDLVAVDHGRDLEPVGVGDQPVRDRPAAQHRRRVVRRRRTRRPPGRRSALTLHVARGHAARLEPADGLRAERRLHLVEHALRARGEPAGAAAPRSATSSVASSHENAAGELPDSAEASTRASASWSAYAAGNALRCTACAASVIGEVAVVVDLDQRVVERVGRVRRVLHLLGGAPALRRPLLEQPERVAVAVVDVAQVGLLVRGGQRDRDRPGRQPAAGGDAPISAAWLACSRSSVDGAAVDLGRCTARRGPSTPVARSPTTAAIARPATTHRARTVTPTALRTASPARLLLHPPSQRPGSPWVPGRPRRPVTGVPLGLTYRAYW